MQDSEPNPAGRARQVRDVIAVFLLSITAVLTAWCGFQASKWGGEMSIAFSHASSARIQAANYEGEARDARQFDLTIYAQWVEASLNNPQLAAYIGDRFTPEFAIAFDAWNANGRQENSPFARPEYVPPGTIKADEWNTRADSKFAEALENNQRGDRYSLLTVLFALVLFLAAMSQRALASWTAWLLLGLGIIAALVGIAAGLTMPIKI